MLLVVGLAGGALEAGADGAEVWQPEPLARSEEIREALAACPEGLRTAAGVYVLTPAGYELERESANGFHAIIQRSQPGAFEPECFDAVGSATILEMVLMKSRLQMGGAGQDEIDLAVGRAWASGELSAPTRPGINYMLSEHNKVPVGPDTVIPYQPHVMFYAPYLTNADLGAEPMGSAPVFVVNEGMPNAYVIVPVGGAEGGHDGH
jgi:hypothetical protein